MTEHRNDAVRECPFCGAAMAHCTDKDGEFWMHPGFVTDDDCFMSGQGIFPRQLTAWNARALSPSPASSPLEGEVREAGWTYEYDGGAGWETHIVLNTLPNLPSKRAPKQHYGDTDIRNVRAFYYAALSTEAGSGEVRAWEYESPDGKERLVRCRRATAGEFPYCTERALTYAVAVAEAGKPAPSEDG